MAGARWGIVAALMLAVGLSLPAAGATGVWVEAEGIASRGAGAGDPAAGAVEAALAEAVRVVAREVSPDAAPPSTPGAYVLAYERLEGACEEDGCRVVLRVKVARGALAAALDAGSPTPEGASLRWVELEIQGIDGWTRLLGLSRALEDVPGVASVRRDGLEADVARLAVRTDRTDEQLAVSLETRVLAGLGLTCFERSEAMLRLRVGHQ